MNRFLCVCFFIMIRRPPRSTWTDTLLPHTTLFRSELESLRSLVPGAIAIVMTIIGTMLTALVVAREWERGTMEAVMSTPASVVEILVGKLLPYFALGMVSTLGAAALAVFVRSEEHTSELQSLMRISYAVFCVKKKKIH